VPARLAFAGETQEFKGPTTAGVIRLMKFTAAALLLALAVLVPPVAAESTVSPASQPPATFKQLVTDIQIMLTELGYRPGTADGKMGSRTRNAIKRYQSRSGLKVDGHPSEALRQNMLLATGRAEPAGGSTVAGAKEGATSDRNVIWRGETVTDSLLRAAPADTADSHQVVQKGVGVEVLRREGSWLEVRVTGTDPQEGWLKFSSVRSTEKQASSAPQKKKGGFWANLTRGVTSMLGGGDPNQGGQGTVTVGVRGLAAEDLAATIPDPAEVDKMESYRADSEQAYRFAGEAKLTAQTVDYLPAAGGSDSSEDGQAAPRRSTGSEK
jgi:peptidoglycan hydrolase-like protein with peptidoglycan-binding domain